MTSDEIPQEHKDRLLAATQLIERTGAEEFQLRYSDEQEPVIWMALASYKREGKPVYQVAASVAPLAAVFELCHSLMNGGTCTHCKRTTRFDETERPAGDTKFCWYSYESETKRYKRSCE